MKYDNFSIMYFDNPYFDDRTAFKVRYRIYCEQYGFLPLTRMGEEIDDFDLYNNNAVIHYRPTGEAVAVVRVIPYGVRGPLPFNKFAPKIAVSGHWGEVSRIGIDKDFNGTPESRKELLVYLFKAIYQLSLDLGVSHWVCMLPTALQLRMAMRGVTFEAIGLPVEYHGVRQPCVGIAHRILSHLEFTDRDMYNFIINR